jgi:hypothetical protein
MSINDNIGRQLDKQFENSGFLPQKLEILDFDKGLSDFFKSKNFSLSDVNDNMRTVPIIWVSQELWAERKQFWKNMTNEQGEEISRPFIAIVRTGVKQGTSPLKRTIPVKRKFTFRKVPKFNGMTKEYDLYKIPQPTYVDIDYEVRFVSSYIIDTNKFYETVIRDCFSDRQGYMNINGYQIRSVMADPSENNLVDVNDERIFQISIPITVFGKLVDPTQFEKVNAITKVAVKITETKG